MLPRILKNKKGFTTNHFSAKNGSGFTLIETLVYIALLGLMMGGTIMAVYEILQGSGFVSTKTTAQNEGSFVLRKINWALSGVKTITVPLVGCGSELAVSKFDGTTAVIQLGSGLDAEKILMKENAGTFLPITTDNVQVTNLQFCKIVSDSIGVSAAVTVKTANSSALDFTTTKYIRQ